MAMAGCCARLVPFRPILGNRLLFKVLKTSLVPLQELNLVGVGPLFNLSRNFTSSHVLYYSKPDVDDSNALPITQEGSWKNKKRPVVHESDDALTHQISQYTSVEDLLEFIESVSFEDFHERAVDVALFNLNLCITDIQGKSAKKEVLRSVGSQKLCRIIKKHSRSLDSQTLVFAMKYFCTLETPGNHPTFQIVLRLLTKHANQMSIQNISYIHYVLDRLQPESKSPISEAFVVALPLVFECQLDLQLVGLKMGDLVGALRYSSIVQSSPQAVAKILKALTENIGDIDLHNARHLLHILGIMSNSQSQTPGLEKIVEHCLCVLSQNVESFNDQILSQLLTMCSINYHQRRYHFYNEDFVEAVCNRLTESKTDYLFEAVKSISTMRHVNIDFLEKVAYEIQRNPQVILNDDALFFNIVRLFSSMSYTPENWNVLKMIFLAHPSLTGQTPSHKQTLSIAVDLMVLDTLPNTLLDSLFGQENFHLIDSWFEKSGPFPLVTIYNAVSQLYPEYKGTLLPTYMINKWEEKMKYLVRNKEYVLEGALQHGIGGQSYVATGLCQKGLIIDHCIVMHEGYPVPIENSDKLFMTLDDITRPKGSQLILFKVYFAEAYSNNVSRLRGIHALTSKILRSFGHHLIEINFDSWNSLMDKEKIPFLMQKVQEIVQQPTK